MLKIINFLFCNPKLIFISLFIVIFFSFISFVKENGKINEDNRILKQDLKEDNIEYEKIITMQSKEQEVMSRPTPSDSDVDQWLLNDFSKPAAKH